MAEATPVMKSPARGGLTGVGCEHRLHVRAPTLRKPPHCSSVHVSRSTATSNARIGSSITSPTCAVVLWRMRPGAVLNGL